MSAEQKRSSLGFVLILLAVAVIILVPKLWREKVAPEPATSKPVSQEQLRAIDQEMQKWVAESEPPTDEELARLDEIMRRNDVNNAKH